MKSVFFCTLVFTVYHYVLKMYKSLQYLQQNRYNRGNKYLKWMRENLKKNFVTFDLLFLLLICFIKCKSIVVIGAYSIISIVVIILTEFNSKKERVKLPLKFTGRVDRLYFTTSIIYLIPIVIMFITFKEEYILYYYLIFIINNYFNNIMVVASNIINIPFEKLVGYYFKVKSLRKLNSMTGMDVIGITGSFGKTSSKNILNDILNVKFNAIKTPKNYNTPFGLMITINDYLDKFNDYFIAEMGACKVGEIKELCDLVHPKYGILTKIGLCHLETFGSEQNIINTKFELIESLPSDGIGILNADDPKQVNYKLKNDCKIVWIGIDNKDADVIATNIVLSKDGTTFDCIFKGDKTKYRFETRLLGKANIYNILAGIALGFNLGISVEQLIVGVKKVVPVEHRLELKRYLDMYMIDDAYNANIDGCKMALDVLNMMPGKRIVISSGMIELGDKSYELNKELGEYMASNADEVILIGKEQTKAVQDGLKNKKFNQKSIHVYNDIMEAFNFINVIKNKETYILLQSDLPDIFNEK